MHQARIPLIRRLCGPINVGVYNMGAGNVENPPLVHIDFVSVMAQVTSLGSPFFQAGQRSYRSQCSLLCSLTCFEGIPKLEWSALPVLHSGKRFGHWPVCVKIKYSARPTHAPAPQSHASFQSPSPRCCLTKTLTPPTRLLPCSFLRLEVRVLPRTPSAEAVGMGSLSATARQRSRTRSDMRQVHSGGN